VDSNASAYSTAKLLALVVFFQALFFSIWVTPLGDTPDESAHYAYVTDLAKGLPLPVLGQVQPDGKGGIASDLWRDWGDDSIFYRENQMPQHPPLYYAVAAVPYKISTLLTDNKTVHAHATRVVSAVCAGLLVWVLFQTLLAAGVGHAQALQVSLWMPLLPMVTHLSSGITNDMFLVLMSAFATLYLVKFLTTQHIRLAYWCAFWLACVGATKMTGWILIAGFVGILLFEMRSTFWRWCVHSIGLVALSTCTAVAWMARNYLLFGNPTHVAGAGGEPNPVHPTLTFVQFFKQQPFIEWLAHHTYGLLGFSGYCLTAPNAEVLAQHCTGVKIVTLSDGFAFMTLLTTLAIIGLVMFAGLIAHLTLHNHRISDPAQPSIQSSVARLICAIPIIYWAIVAVTLVFALLLFQHFTTKSFRFNAELSSAMVSNAFGLLFIWSVLGLATVFLSKSLNARIASYGMVFAVLFTLFLFYKSYQEFVDIGQLRGVQGRYLFPYYPLILMGVAMALHRLKVGRYLIAVITALLLLGHFVAYTGTFIPFFNAVRLS